jgi:hypothetical protein
MLTKRGRWFEYKGRPFYFMGADLQSLAARVDLDGERPYYVGALDHLCEAGINKVRIWGNCYFMPAGQCLQPFAWDSALGKWDLDTWSDAYWARIKDFVREAQARDIIVEFTLFSTYGNEGCWKYEGNYWSKTLNKNGAFTANAAGHYSPEQFHTGAYGLPVNPETTTSGHDIGYYQNLLLEKAVGELQPFGNVYFEIYNEWPGMRHPTRNHRLDMNRENDGRYKGWQYGIADSLKAQGALVSVHAGYAWSLEERQQYCDRYFDHPSVDILTVHYFSGRPDYAVAFFHDSQRKDKILQVNETHPIEASKPETLDRVTREAWAMLCAGGYFSYYHGDKAFPKEIGTPEWKAWMRRLAIVREVAESLPFSEMLPVDEQGREYAYLVRQGPTTGWMVFCQPGTAYLAYFWCNWQEEPTDMDIALDLPEGAYRYEILDPRSKDVLGAGTVRGEQPAHIPCPDLAAWSALSGLALVVRRS